jgi:lipoate-protein ligase A
MNCTSLSSHDPFFCLALEEVLLKDSTEEFLLLYINDPCVVIGKHQAPHRETDTRFVTKFRIPVIRRISGGGTVYHDGGNLNFSFIVNAEEGKQIDFRKHTQPVIRFLASLGVDAKFEGKNDLKVDGYKISGNAEHVHRKRVLHHGTLLFDASLEKLTGSIRKDYSSYTTRAVQSNPSRVVNLHERLTFMHSASDLMESMCSWSLQNIPGAGIYQPSESETNAARSRAEQKYSTWEWNYAYGPEYHFRKSFYLDKEYLSCRLFVKDGIIWECRIEGSESVAAMCKSFIGARHMPESMIDVFRENGIKITDEEIFNFF